jgi:hypothetical protein
MNMISTGAFQTEMDASSKQPSLAKKFAAAWEKKNAKAARAGGVSLMALSLAACGSDDATTTTATTTTDTTTTDTTTTVVTPASQAFVLTKDADTIVGGDGDDTISGLSGTTTEAATDTLNVTDTIDGGAGTDTMTVINSASNSGALGESVVTNVEIFNVRQTLATGTSDFNAALISGETNVNHYLSAGDVTITNLEAGAAAGMIGNGTMTSGILKAGWAATVTSGTVNIVDTKLSGAITTSGTLLTTNTITSTGSANTTGAVSLGAAVTTLNIDATTNLTTGALANTGAAAMTTLTVTGAGKVDIDAAVLEAKVSSIDASGNSGGFNVDLGSLVTQTVVGSSGDDQITAGNVLTTGSVNAGAGTDTLVLDDATFVATAALGAKYTNFETLTVNGISQDVSLVSGITTVNVGAGTSEVYSGLTGAQASSGIQVNGDGKTATTFTLANATGTADALTLNLGTGLLATASTDLPTSLVVTGFETLNLNTNQGPNATAANSVSTIGAITGATLADINLTGGGFTITDAATTLATTINGAELTGVLTVGGNVIAGSTITGGAGKDVFTAGTKNGSTYNGGANNDQLSATVAQLVATGANDTAFAGGAGTDTLVATGANVTLTDNHFMNISGIEALTTTGTGNMSFTGGAAFNAAVDGKVTITDGATAVTKTITVAMGLATDDITVSSIGGVQTGATTEDVNITTGSGADTVTFSATKWLAVAGASGECNISTGAGNDTIVHTVGILKAAKTKAPAVITGGTGADTITTTHVNPTKSLSVTFAMAAGDSTVAGYDTITGFDLATASLISDTLDFSGTAIVGLLATHNDNGVILSHSIATGVASFDDAAGYAAALVINSGNLSDVVGYLNANANAEGTVAFLFDSTGDGLNDGTMVYHNETGATDTVVFLSGATTTANILITNAHTLNDLFIA